MVGYYYEIINSITPQVCEARESEDSEGTVCDGELGDGGERDDGDDGGDGGGKTVFDSTKTKFEVQIGYG